MKKINYSKKLSDLRVELRSKVAEIEEILDEMPDKGDKCFESQKICLINSLCEFESCVNGITLDDIKEE